MITSYTPQITDISVLRMKISKSRDILRPGDEDTSHAVGGIASSGRIDFKSGEWKRLIDPGCSGSY